MCRRLVKELDIHIYSVNYRHTDQYKWPAAKVDAECFMESLFKMIQQRGDLQRKIIVGGIDSGAHLAMQMVEIYKAKFDNHVGDKPGESCHCPVMAGVMLGTPWVYIDPDSFPENEFVLPSSISRYQCREAPLLYVITPSPMCLLSSIAINSWT